MENHISYLKNGRHHLRNIWIEEENRWVDVNSEVCILCGERFGMFTMTFKCECCEDFGKIYYFFSLQENDYILRTMDPVVRNHIEDEFVISLPDGTLGNFILTSRMNHNDTQILKFLKNIDNDYKMVANPQNLSCFFKFLRNEVLKKGCFKFWKLCVTRSQMKQNRMTALYILTKKIDEAEIRKRIIQLAQFW